MKHHIIAATLALFFGGAYAANAPTPELPPLPPAGIPAPAPSVPVLEASFAGGIRLTEFARVVLQDVLHAPFVFSSDFLSSSAQVGFSSAQLKKSGTESLLRDVLAEHGFSLERKGAFYRVGKLQEQDKVDNRQDFFYRPKYRDLGYLSGILQPLFPNGGFTYKRQIDPGQSSPNGQSQQQAGQGGPGRATDNGQSLYSMTNQTNVETFIYRGSEKDVSRLKKILEQIDTPVPRVLVRAFVLEVASNETTGYSVSAVANLLSGRLGLNLGTAATANALTFKNANFQAVASAFASDNSVKVLTAPSIFAETGAVASLSVGNSVPTLGSITYNGNGQSQQSVTYTDTGVILRFTPRVLDDAISINLEQELSDAIQTQTGVQASPTLTKRNLKTTLNLNSGDWVILGGLSSNKSSNMSSGLPFFRSIFSSGSEQARSDIVVVLYVEKS